MLYCVLVLYFEKDTHTFASTDLWEKASFMITLGSPIAKAIIRDTCKLVVKTETCQV